MRTYPSGYLEIHSNHEQKKFSLEEYPCTSFVGEDYIGVSKFDYAEIFEDVVKCTDKTGYVIPTTQESFNKSLLWAELGFNVTDDFEITFLAKEFELNHYMTHGQKAGYTIDMKAKWFFASRADMVNNRLDLMTYDDWPDLYWIDGGEDYSSGEIIYHLVEIFNTFFFDKSLDRNELPEVVRAYLLQFGDEDGTPLDDTQIEDISSAMEMFLEPFMSETPDE